MPLANFRKQQNERCRESQRGRYGQQSLPKTTGCFSQPTDDEWTCKPAQVADGVDRGNARRGGGAGKKLSRDAPQRRFRRTDAGADENQRHDGQHEAGAEGRDHQPRSREKAREDDVPVAFSGPVGVPGPQDHCDDREYGRHGIDDACCKRSYAVLRDDLRRPDSDRVEPCRGAEIDQRERQDPRVRHGLQHGLSAVRLCYAGFFCLHLRHKPVAFLLVQPLGVLGPIGQIHQDHGGQQDGRRRFDQEEPLPAVQSQNAVHGQQCSGNRRSDGDGNGHGGHEECRHAGSVAGRKPVAQVQDDPWEKAGFGSAEQEAQDIETHRPLNKRHGARDDPPGEHDPGNPYPRTDAMQDEIRRHLEQEIADEENAGAETEGRR